jgi:hypothetical protein
VQIIGGGRDSAVPPVNADIEARLPLDSWEQRVADRDAALLRTAAHTHGPLK